MTRPALDERFTPADNDPMLVHALLADEVVQRRESGYDVDEIVIAANALASDDRDGLLDLVDRMGAAQRSGWRWEEPEGLDAIEANLTDRPGFLHSHSMDYADRVHAAWLGRIVGCNLGKPLEWGDHWTVEHIEDYLRRADAYPLADYVPVLDPLPEEFDLNASWVFSARGRVDGSARDDDIDYTILALHLLETHGSGLTSELVGAAWLELLPLRQVFTAERAAYINLVNGLAPPETARHRNPYREWIGAQIRGDLHGYLHPGDPWAAAVSAYEDARLSHTGNGVYGAMWSAALNAAAFTAGSAREALETSMRVIPPRSRLADALRSVITSADDGVDWVEARRRIAEAYGHYSWVHTINNAAIVALGLLFGEDDYLTSVSRTVMSGLDTDSNGATVGSVAGILAGATELPGHLVEPLHDRTRSALFGFDGVRISHLAGRTTALAEQMGTRGS